MVYLNELRLVHSAELLSTDYSIVSISKCVALVVLVILIHNLKRGII